MERFSPAPPELINEKNPYIESLRAAGITMREVTKEGSLFNAVVYNQESNLDKSGTKKLILLPGVPGEAGGTSHISASFLTELQETVDTVIGFNSGLSKTALQERSYVHDAQMHTRQIVDLYKQAIPEDKKDEPIIIVGHSMGSGIAPSVAEELLRQGYNVSDIILVAFSGFSDRSQTAMLRDVTKLGEMARIHPDIPALYPSPVDLHTIRDRYQELSQKTASQKLSREEVEELAYYGLVQQRAINPDKLTLSNLDEEARKHIQAIDDEMTYLLASGKSVDNSRLAKLQRKRMKILNKPIRKVIGGKLHMEPTQQKVKSKVTIARNLVQSLPEARKIVTDLARESSADAVESLINYNNASTGHDLAITAIGGKNDPIIGDYEVGHVNRVHVGPHTTYSEIEMSNFDHFTLSDDPVRVAQTIERIVG